MYNPFVRIKNSTAGITLIALVIIIIVLLILVGISIAMLLGDNGILSNAEKSKEEQVHGDISESLMLEHGDYEVEKIQELLITHF